MNLGKWFKHTCMMRNYELAAYLPETYLYSEYSLEKMLQKHQQVILKPDNGLCGIGIIILIEKENGRYLLHYKNKSELFDSKREAIRTLRQLMVRSQYLIQPFIPMLKIKDRPIDLRIMVQRRENKPWVVTGMLAKVAMKGYRITNPEEKVLPVKGALKKTSLRESPSSIVNELNVIAVDVAEQLEEEYPDLMLIGLDVLIDLKGRIWIIEANFNPMVSWFADLPDKSMYRRVLSYQKERRFQQKWLKKMK